MATTTRCGLTADPAPAVPVAPPAAGARFWLMQGDKLGDNAQALALAGAIGWPYAVKTLIPRAEWVLGKPSFRPGLDHLDLERSSPLEPPWPDLVLTIGRRPSMAALWVREQSGGRTRVVLINRPKKGSLDAFALIVVPAQFRIPPHPKIAHLDLPLMRADADAVRAAADRWRGRLADLPRPLTAVLIGGATKPYRFDGRVANELLEALRRLQARDGGTVYLTTSRRTQPAIVAALEAGLPPDAQLYRWRPETAEDNPYLALLGLADRCVVSGDSISMMIEVASLGQPLAIFPLPVAPGLGTWLVQALSRLTDPSRAATGPVAGLAHLGHRLGLFGYARDLTAVHRALFEKGLAVPLGEPFPPAGKGLEDELRPVIDRVRALVA